MLNKAKPTSFPSEVAEATLERDSQYCCSTRLRACLSNRQLSNSGAQWLSWITCRNWQCLSLPFICKAGTRLLDLARKKLFVRAVAVLRGKHHVLHSVFALEKFYHLQDAMLRYDPLHRISARQTLLHESPAQTTVSPDIAV